MRIIMTEGGILEICAENGCEHYALKNWLNRHGENLETAEVDISFISESNGQEIEFEKTE